MVATVSARMTPTTCNVAKVAPAQPARAAAFGRINGLRAQKRCQPFTVTPAPREAKAIVAQAAPQEVAQLAIDAGFIWGTAGICFAMTLVGVAVGFVLLRVESLVEEGKL